MAAVTNTAILVCITEFSLHNGHWNADKLTRWRVRAPEGRATYRPSPIKMKPAQYTGWLYLVCSSFSAASLRASALVRAEWVASLLWNSIIRSAVLAESTLHWLTTVAGTPAMKKAQLIPMIPSPALTAPLAVSQPDRMTSSAFRFSLIISH